MWFTSRWRRIFGWAALLLWPALLPHPANAFAACIWYTILGLSGLIYFLSRIQDDTAEAQAPTPAEDSNLSVSSTSSPMLLASVPGSSGQPWPEESDSR